MKNTKQHEKGKIEKLWPFLVRLHKENPGAFENEHILKYHVSKPWEALKDKTHCPNCGESMAIYTVRLDWHNAALLSAMGNVFLKNIKKGMPFTEANKIHVVSTDVGDATRHRTSQCRTLGLIAKVMTDDKKHDRSKGWLITKRGFAALRGESVPASVNVFRNRIEERENVQVTLGEVFASSKGKESRHDPNAYVEIAGMHQGNLL